MKCKWWNDSSRPVLVKFTAKIDGQPSLAVKFCENDYTVLLAVNFLRRQFFTVLLAVNFDRQKF